MDDLTRELRAATWTTSSPSGSNGGNRVEVARPSDGRKGVRDSENPSGPALVFSSAEWAAFIGGVKRDEFD